MTPLSLPLTGSCLCGAVRVSLTARPFLTLACHCRDCQKLTASAFSMTSMFARDSFSVVGDLVVGGLHSPDRTHHFCPACQTFIFSEIASAPERVNLRTSILNDAARFPPFVELMTDEKLPWAHVPVEHSYAQRPESLAELRHIMDSYARL